MEAQGLDSAAQGLCLEAQGLHIAAQGLHLAAQGLHLAAQGLHIVYMRQMLYLARYWLPGGASAEWIWVPGVDLGARGFCPGSPPVHR